MNFDLEVMIGAYVECALWSSTDWPDDGEPTENLDANYGPDDLSPELLASVREDCAAFADANADDLAEMAEILPPRAWSAAESAGHDFWLTRNRHGAGFWDRGLGDVGDRLTEAAHVYGETDWYVGDDGRLYA